LDHYSYSLIYVVGPSAVMIVGIVLGVIIFLFIIVAIAVYALYKKSAKKAAARRA